MNSDKKNIQAGIKSFFGPKTRTYLEAAQKALNKTPPNENNVQVTAVKHAEGGFEEVKNSEGIELKNHLLPLSVTITTNLILLQVCKALF